LWACHEYENTDRHEESLMQEERVSQTAGGTESANTTAAQEYPPIRIETGLESATMVAVPRQARARRQCKRRSRTVFLLLRQLRRRPKQKSGRGEEVYIRGPQNRGVSAVRCEENPGEGSKSLIGLIWNA